MAVRNRSKMVPGIGSTNVTALTFTYSSGVTSYTSGGIPQGAIVKLDASDTTNGAVVLAGTGDYPLGVADTYPAITAGDPVQIQTEGIARCLAGASCSKGDLLYVTDASGRVGPAPALGATNAYLVGQAEEAAVQAGDLIQVYLRIGSLTKANA